MTDIPPRLGGAGKDENTKKDDAAGPRVDSAAAIVTAATHRFRLLVIRRSSPVAHSSCSLAGETRMQTRPRSIVRKDETAGEKIRSPILRFRIRRQMSREWSTDSAIDRTHLLDS